MFNRKPETPATSTHPPAIAAALARLDESTKAVSNIKSLSESARAERQKTKREHDEAFGALGEAEAAALLDGASAASQSLRKAVEKHAQNLLALDARIAGLASRERSAAAEIERAIIELSGRLDEWIATERDKAREEFQAALDRFIQDVARPISTGIALGDARMATIARNTTIPNCRDERNGFDAIRYYHGNQAMAETLAVYSDVRRTVRSAVDGAAVLTLAATSI